MVNKIKHKKGFSLAEALISMLILSVFFIATSKIMTTKQRPDEQVNPHGFYECYVVNGELKQRRASESSVTAEQSVESCTFSPPQGIAFATLYAVRDSENIILAMEPQFNNPIDPISSVNALRDFGLAYLDNSEPNDLNIEGMRRFLEISYPRSGLLAIIRNGTYQNNDPALFIGW